MTSLGGKPEGPQRPTFNTSTPTCVMQQRERAQGSVDAEQWRPHNRPTVLFDFSHPFDYDWTTQCSCMFFFTMTGPHQVTYS